MTSPSANAPTPDHAYNNARRPTGADDAPLFTCTAVLRPKPSNGHRRPINQWGVTEISRQNLQPRM